MFCTYPYAIKGSLYRYGQMYSNIPNVWFSLPYCFTSTVQYWPMKNKEENINNFKHKDKPFEEKQPMGHSFKLK